MKTDLSAMFKGKKVILLGAGVSNMPLARMLSGMGAVLEVRDKKTKDELGAAVGVTRQTVISLENGKYNASLQLAYKIAKYFDTTIENIFIFEEVSL